MSTNENFYHELKAFREFNDLTDARHFVRVPSDWVVVVADIKGSTMAIESGRYKDVNTLGAACIVAAQNAMNKEDFPFSFGGDGATLLIPPSKAPAVASALKAVRRMARTQFDMILRVGRIGVAEVENEGVSIEVAKYNLVSKQSIALFRGGGIAKAEERIKGRTGTYGLPDDGPGESDLTGLSCRWKPIPAKQGKILSLLVLARAEPSAPVYGKVLAKLDEILGGDAASANPIRSPKKSYQGIVKLWRDEVRLHHGVFSLAFLKRAFEIVYAVLVFKYGFPALFIDAQGYADSMSAHSDFRKFDDVLRMVVDCSKGQVAEITAYLEGLHRAGEIAYGATVADEALMTCFVYGVTEGEHIHFVDGGDGGYAMAAKQFKAQLKEAIP